MELDNSGEYDDEVNDKVNDIPKKQGFPSIDSLGAKPSAGNPGYGVSSVFDDDINMINDLNRPFRNY
jgi:hypothetical protein